MNAPALPAKSPTTFRTFTDALERAAARRAEPAVWDAGRWRTWRDCRDQAERTAGVLHRRGLASGDVLAAWLPNSWELVVLHAATARLGVLLLPLHSAYGAHEARALIEQAGAVALAAGAAHRGHDRLADLLGLRDRCPTLRHVWVSPGGGRAATAGLPDLAELLPGEGETDHGTPALPPPPDDPRAPLVLLASSGTTSRRPKLCVHSHAGLLGNAAAVAADGGPGAGDTVVSASPLSHAFGLLSVHLALVTGGAVGLFADWEPRRFAETLAAVHATAAFAVPAQLRDLLAVLGEKGEPGPPALREVRTGGAPVPRELADGVRRTLGARLVVQWGMTEVGAGTYTRPGDPPGATATIGRPATGAEVRVLTGDGEPAAPGETGELHYRSPYMFSGYYRAPERTRVALGTDGWLRTGDLAALEPDGSVVYRGRSDELINRGGLKFSALEVEELLDDLPQLAQHAVLGRPDPRLGQRSCLVAALREGARLTLEEVTGHLTAKGLATYKLPEQLVLVDRLPTTVTGKTARARLRAMPLPPLPARPPRSPR
ncbi:class I adenylate-forming enzyme family protein [Streptomyces filamentosus]|uniref:Cyclohexanecarboxylate-CoA ligase n=1 Tax=Streptomyces filamentosus TaxID=67294 RepID=A0A919ERX8_STRFL|nr:AMP-binding protein [Streptomyces filamentosus]GHG21801.1 cyclohexanecarboxylate-CoA ligase [Streptomyces filamentosus]